MSIKHFALNKTMHIAKHVTLKVSIHILFASIKNWLFLSFVLSQLVYNFICIFFKYTKTIYLDLVSKIRLSSKKKKRSYRYKRIQKHWKAIHNGWVLNFNVFVLFLWWSFFLVKILINFVLLYYFIFFDSS